MPSLFHVKSLGFGVCFIRTSHPGAVTASQMLRSLLSLVVTLLSSTGLGQGLRLGAVASWAGNLSLEGPSCASQGVWQQPWLLTPRCQSHSPSCDDQKGSPFWNWGGRAVTPLVMPVSVAGSAPVRMNNGRGEEGALRNQMHHHMRDQPIL